MLPDYLEGNLRVLAIGINPSLLSDQLGFPFAHPQNRFWPALNASRLVDAPITPGIGAMSTLNSIYQMGFTDIGIHTHDNSRCSVLRQTAWWNGR